MAEPPREVAPPSLPPIVGPWTPRWLRHAAVGAAATWLSFVALDSTPLSTARLLPLPLRFFVQVAQLFPRAAEDTIEWHAKGWRCDGQQFEELELRSYFPIHADDKENRFDRAMFFYNKDRRVLEALDDFISAEETRRGRSTGGVMLMSLRLPIPPLGSDEPRYRRLRTAEIGPDVARRYWYVTRPDERDRRCRR